MENQETKYLDFEGLQKYDNYLKNNIQNNYINNDDKVLNSEINSLFDSNFDNDSKYMNFESLKKYNDCIKKEIYPIKLKYERIDELAESIRGRSILGVNTAPYANLNSTPDGKIHQMTASMKLIKSEANIDEVFLGDTILYNGYIYQVAYIDHDKDNASTSQTGGVYLDMLGNINGPQGIQGIQGNQGPQGPKGDPGEGFFIVTDEDYSKIADFVEEKSYHSYQRPDSSEPLRPNIFYDFGIQYNLEITFNPPQSIYRSNEYMFQFISPSDRPTTLIMPDSVKWCYDPIIEAGKTYQVSVLNDLGVICGA